MTYADVVLTIRQENEKIYTPGYLGVVLRRRILLRNPPKTLENPERNTQVKADITVLRNIPSGDGGVY